MLSSMSVGRDLVVRKIIKKCTQMKNDFVSNLGEINNHFSVINDKEKLRLASLNDFNWLKPKVRIPKILDGKNILCRFFYSRDELSCATEKLYSSCCDSLNMEEYFEKFDLKDDFNSWFNVTALHVYFLLNKAKTEGAFSSIFNKNIIDLMWIDMNYRLKLYGVERNDHRKENMKTLYSYFNGFIMAIDEGIIGSDSTLASSIWKSFNFKTNTTNIEVLCTIIKYIRQHVSFFYD